MDFNDPTALNSLSCILLGIACVSQHFRIRKLEKDNKQELFISELKEQ